MVFGKIRSVLKRNSAAKGGMIIRDTDPSKPANKPSEQSEQESQSNSPVSAKQNAKPPVSRTIAAAEQEPAELQKTLAIQMFDPTQPKPAAITPSGQIITHSPFDPAAEPKERKELPEFSGIESDQELHEAVEKVIDARIRPMIQSHQGDIELVKIEDNVVTVRLTGTCVGCAMSTVTLKYGVKKDITAALPQIKDVDAIFAY